MPGKVYMILPDEISLSLERREPHLIQCKCDWEIRMMSTRKAIRIRYLHGIWVAALFVFVLWLMSVLKCEMATPAY